MKAIRMKTDSGAEVLIQIDDETEAVTTSAKGKLADAKGKKVVRALGTLGTSIGDVCETLYSSAIKKLKDTKPDKLELEFGVKLSGKAAIPLITEANAEGSVKVTATWQPGT